jgi:hypothetical protein
VTDATAIELLALAGIGLVAGWINTVAGAGSLLLLPALIFTGLDASEANATNRIGILAQTLAAVIGYRRAGMSIARADVVLTVAAMVGGGIGSFVATLLDPSEMQIAIVIAMGVMLVLSLVPSGKKKDATPDGAEPAAPAAPPTRLPAPTPGMIAVFVAIGIYGGFLQAGVGILVLLYLSLAHGIGLVASNVVKSTVTLALTIVAIAVFASRGEGIDVARGGVLAITSALGGLAGARSTVALGDRFVRVAVTLAVLVSMIKLIADMI